MTILLPDGRWTAEFKNPVRGIETVTADHYRDGPRTVGLLIVWVTGAEPMTAYHQAYGELGTLLRNPDTPPGVWIDRIEEYPHELQVADPLCTALILDFLRTKYPNGV